MAFRFIPREEKFYQDFLAISDELKKGARLLEEMLEVSRIETGRFQDASALAPLYANALSPDEYVSQDTVRLQYSKCESSILPGPQKTLRWGVPDGARGPDGQLVHDDFLLADSLVAMLDKLEWVSYSPTLIVPGRDSLEDMDRNF